jgi:tRNA(adenine34) deaminase
MAKAPAYEMYSHEYFMNEALKEARKALEKDEVPIGAIVVSQNTIIARAHNLTETLTDATAHAEMQAITAASGSLGGKYLNECTLYVTIEPCVMCAGAIFWAQLGAMIYGATDPKRGYSLVGEELLHPSTIVESGILEKECSVLLTEFFRDKR